MNSFFSGLRVVCTLIGITLLSQVATAQVFLSKSGDNTTGTSWATALHSLSTAVTQAQSSATDVWIAADTYTVSSTVSVPTGVNIYGGFPATGNPGFGDRNADTYRTILDGTDVTWRILVYDGSTYAKIEGITFANVDGYSGGGISVVNSADIDIIECDFIGDRDADLGAGLYIEEAHADIEDCVFEDNFRWRDGGAIELDEGSAIILRCEFRRNGPYGAIRAYKSPLQLDSCEFEENDGQGGGAVFVERGTQVTISNSLFYRNKSNGGGGVHFDRQSGIVLTSCTFVENTAWDGGGGVYLYQSSGQISNNVFIGNSMYAIYEKDVNSDPTVSNNLFYQNTDGVYFDENSTGIQSVTLLNSSLAEASGNIDSDPDFVASSHGDFHLRSTSSAIDFGTILNAPAEDFDGETRPVDIVSIGSEGVGVAYDIGFDEYLDTDGDGLPDYWEDTRGLDSTSSAGDDGTSGDPDGDSLSNSDEFNAYYTNPTLADSDGDGLDDDDEILTYLTDPNERDTDGDSVSDGDEVSNGTDPNVKAAIFVSKSGNNTTGTSWTTALHSLSAAVTLADSSNKGCMGSSRYLYSSEHDLYSVSR